MSKKDKEQGQGQASLLGENTIDLAPMTPDLTNLKGVAVRQKIELLRNQGDTNLIVGILNVSFKLLVLQKFFNSRLKI